jgi:hypothetical protein
MTRIAFLALFFAAFALRAADKTKTFSYTGEITGVVCVACKDKICTVLSKNLADTVSVNVKPGEKQGIQKLIIVSKSDHLELGQAVAALGEYSKEYEIKSLARGE